MEREPSGCETIRFNVDVMRTVMSAPFEWFEQFGTVREGRTSWRQDTPRHIYIDRGSKVLGVAHLDSVQPFKGFWINHEYIACATIDNRLGAWLMLYGLPSLGINFDVLLTENEEYGMSTASDFVAEKEYNWGFSFDRTGDDVVTYQYSDKDLEAALESCGLEVGWGSYSDISDLDIKAKCFNVGCGMYNYHSEGAFAHIEEMALNVRRFATFYADYKDVSLPHTGGAGRWSQWDEYDWRGSLSGESYYYSDEKGATLTYPMELKSRSLVRWDTIDSYYADMATRHPLDWFQDTDFADEWHYNHSLGNINLMEAEDDACDLYFDGIAELCYACDNLFVRGDINHYASLGQRLCKACFQYVASEEGFPEGN